MYCPIDCPIYVDDAAALRRQGLVLWIEPSTNGESWKQISEQLKGIVDLSVSREEIQAKIAALQHKRRTMIMDTAIPEEPSQSSMAALQDSSTPPQPQKAGSTASLPDITDSVSPTMSDRTTEPTIKLTSSRTDTAISSTLSAKSYSQPSNPTEVKEEEEEIEEEEEEVAVEQDLENMGIKETLVKLSSIGHVHSAQNVMFKKQVSGMVYVSDEELYSGDDDDLQDENEEATEEATEDVPKPVADESTNPTIGFLPKIPSRISVNPDINKKKENKAGHRRS